MPISRKDFEEGNFKKKATNRWDHPVAVFLREHSNSAFTVKEITKVVKMNEDTVRGAVKVLEKEEKLILHKVPQFIWKKPNQAKKKVKKKLVKRKR